MSPSNSHILTLFNEALRSKNNQEIQTLLKNNPALHTEFIYRALKTDYFSQVQTLITNLARQPTSGACGVNTSALEEQLSQFIADHRPENTLETSITTPQKPDIRLLKQRRNQIFLFEAVKKENFPLIAYLLRDGTTPSLDTLRIAVQRQRSLTVKQLLQHGADPNLQDKHNPYSVLCMAIRNPNPKIDIIRLLLQYKANTDIITPQGETPLHYAVRHNAIEIVDALLYKGADVNATDKTNHTPLHYAVNNNHLPIIKRLVLYQAEIQTDIIYNAIQQEGNTHQKNAIVEYLLPLKSAEALHDAVARERFDILPLLLQCFLDYHLDIDIEDKIHHKTALYWAIAKCNVKLVNLLLAYGAKLDPKGTTIQETFLHHAARVDSRDRGALREVIEILLQHGARIDAVNALDNTPLDEAILYSRLDVAKVLIRYHQEPISFKFFRNVIYTGHMDLFNDALKHQPSMETKDQDGSTLLHLAAQIGDVDIIKRLLDQQLDINTRNSHNQTPLSLAIEHKHQAAIKLLLDNGANTDAFQNALPKRKKHYLGLHPPSLRHKTSLPLFFFSKRPLLHRNASSDLLSLGKDPSRPSP